MFMLSADETYLLKIDEDEQEICQMNQESEINSHNFWEESSFWNQYARI